MLRFLTSLLLVLLLLPNLARADETVRQVQEELRKRNLYFGNIDGKTSAVLSDALKRYQARKGFAVTGKVDSDTATSLHVPRLHWTKRSAVAATRSRPRRCRADANR